MRSALTLAMAREPQTGLAARHNRPPRSVGLDVARSLAIICVLASHYGTYFTGWYQIPLPFTVAVAGFFGVELFFVLSGFLIGRLLIEILDAGLTARGWLIFMVRRWMRTLPLYFICLLVLALIWRPAFWQPDRSMLWRDLPWYLTMTQNFAWPMVDNWFGVTWSLTVEEWFYLLFSMALWAAAMVAGRRCALWGTLLLFLCLPAWLRWQLPPDVNWDEVTSKVVPYRLDAIAFGVVAAWCCVRNVVPAGYRSLLLLAAGLGIIALVWSSWLIVLLHPSRHAWATFGFDITSFGFALCMPAAASIRWRPHRWLAGAAHRLGEQSYAIYLIHLSLIEIISYYGDRLHVGAAGKIAVTALSLWGITWLSLRFIERPIMALRPLQHRR